MSVDLDPAIQSAVIQSSGGIIATLIAAISASVIGKRFVSKKKLQENLLMAQRDIEFLLAVEEEHCALHMEASGKSQKNRVRQLARERDFVWSGKFTPGRANDSPTLQEAKQACA